MVFHPRPTAKKYAAHAESNGATLGATRLNASQLRKALSMDKITASDLEESSVVIEVGLYPPNGGKVAVSLDGFALRARCEDASVKPVGADVVVARLPYWVQVDQSSGGTGGGMMPRSPVDHDPIGISRDPITGMPRRGGGTTVPNGADGGIGIGGSNPLRPASSPQRRNLQVRMMEKALPEGDTISPVAGYIYFSAEKKKDARYELEYTLNGKKIVLPL
jgi:hypothetical protein